LHACILSHCPLCLKGGETHPQQQQFSSQASQCATAIALHHCSCMLCGHMWHSTKHKGSDKAHTAPLPKTKPVSTAHVRMTGMLHSKAAVHCLDMAPDLTMPSPEGAHAEKQALRKQAPPTGTTNSPTGTTNSQSTHAAKPESSQDNSLQYSCGAHQLAHMEAQVGPCDTAVKTSSHKIPTHRC
jgi:hypothetical protein